MTLPKFVPIKERVVRWQQVGVAWVVRVVRVVGIVRINEPRTQ